MAAAVPLGAVGGDLNGVSVLVVPAAKSNIAESCIFDFLLPEHALLRPPADVSCRRRTTVTPLSVGSAELYRVSRRCNSPWQEITVWLRSPPLAARNRSCHFVFVCLRRYS